MDIYEIRKLRLKELVHAANVELGKSKGGIARIAELAETDANHLSAILSNTSPAKMGSELARKIEMKLQRKPGWMDSPTEDGMREILDALPDLDEKEVLNFTRYRLEKAAEKMEPKALDRYLQMIDDMLGEIEQRFQAAEGRTLYNNGQKGEGQ